jgi:nitrogen fixation negative regulator NifL
MNRTIRVLHIEDSEQDVALVTRHLSLARYNPISERVETAEAMKAALETKQWNVILCDYSLPQFNALGALALVKEMQMDIPFIIISGTIGEPLAVEAMRAGAHDYLMKDNLVRLAPIIERELHEAENRRARRTAEEQLQLQSTALESAANCIVITDENGMIIWVNQAFTQTTGYSFKEALGKNPRLLKSGKQGDAFYQKMWETILSGKVWHNTVINRRKDGTLNHVDLTITPIHNAAGRITNFVGIKQDITERIKAEEALQASELRYRRLFESAKDGILILNADSGQIVDVNPYLIEALGFSKEELAGKELWEIGAFKDIVASKIAFVELRQHGYIRYENLPLQSREGLVRQVEFVSNSYLAGESRVIQCNIRDITERKLAEEDLRQTNQRLEAALAELQTRTHELASMTQQLWQASKLATMGELAASVAHELNNPLATLALHAESLLDRFPSDDPKRRAVHVIEQEVERMASLVSNLLLFSRRSHQQFSTVNIDEELRNSFQFIHYHLRSHSITIATDIANDLPSVHADRQQLRQVFLNLLTNASDAMPEGGTLTVRAKKHSLENGSAAVMVEFSDSGRGIEPEDLQKVWEPFFTTKSEGKGTGLGLPICRRTVEEHRGTIDIESLPGKGTTVRIILPAIETGATKA